MDGATSAIVWPTVRTMRAWGDAIRRKFSSYCRAKGSRNLTRDQCSQTLQDSCGSNPTPKDCETVSGGDGFQCYSNLGCEAGHELAEFDPQIRRIRRALHVQQAAQIRAFRAAWAEAGHTRVPRVSVSRSIFALVNDLDRAYFGRGGQEEDQIGFLDATTRAVFGRSYAAEPDILVEQLRNDEAIAEADTLLLTVPNQLGVAYNVHVMEAILTTVAPALGWR